MSYKAIAIKGARWTAAGTLTSNVVRLVQFMLLARWLTKDEYGLMSLVFVVRGLTYLFLDLGTNAAIIHRQNIPEKQLRGLYFVHLAVSTLLMILLIVLAPYIAGYYQSPELAPLLRLTSWTVLLVAPGNLYVVLLQKHLKFGALVAVNLSAVVVNFLVTVGLVFWGYGVSGVVYGDMAGVVAFTLVALALAPRRIMPAMSFSGLKPFFSFGMYQMGEHLSNYLVSQFDVLLIGRLMGTAEVGLYSMAKNLTAKPFQLINPVINRVSFPIMAKVQDVQWQLRSYYLKGVRFAASANYPVYLLLYLLADWVVVYFFGEKWLGAVPVVRLLAVYRMFTSIVNLIGSLQLARGRADMGFYWNLALLLLVPPVIYVGSGWGVTGVAATLVVLEVFLFGFVWYFMVRPLAGIGWGDYTRAVGGPLLMALVAGILGEIWLSLRGYPAARDLVTVAGAVVIMAGVILILYRRWNRLFLELLVGAVSRSKKVDE